MATVSSRISARLVIAPFLHPAMNGTTAKYRWCRADIAVQYHTPYAFTVTASALPQPVVIRFLNQTPGKTYAVQTDAERLERTADADGNVDVPMAHLQGTFTLCDPDEEIRPDEGNLALDRPAKASTTLHGELFTRHWSEKLTDGRVDNGFWTHEPEDLTPYAAVDFGHAHRAGAPAGICGTGGHVLLPCVGQRRPDGNRLDAAGRSLGRRCTGGRGSPADGTYRRLAED